MLNKLDLTRLKKLDLHALAERAGGDNPTAFVVYTDNDNLPAWFCHRCEKGGDTLAFVQEWQGFASFIETVRWLADYANIPLEDLGYTAKKARAQHEQKLRREVLALAAQYYAAQLWSAAGANALTYARGRGFPDDVIRLAGFGYSAGDRGLHTHLQQAGADLQLARKIGLLRKDSQDFTANQHGQAAAPTGWLVYPHQTRSPARRKRCKPCQTKTWHLQNSCLLHEDKRPPLSSITSLSARALEPTNPKDKARNLPGKRQLYKAEVPGDRRVILVEGQADAESLRQLGYSAWALCGLGKLPDDDLRRLQQRPVVFLSLDDDPAGLEKRDKLANRLGPLTMIIPAAMGAKDFNQFLQDSGQRETLAQEILPAATPWLDSLLKRAREAPPYELEQLTTQIARHLQGVPASLRSRYYKQAQAAVGLSRTELLMLANGRETGQGLMLSAIRRGQLIFMGEPLGNFAFRVTHEQVLDDGLNFPETVYTVAGELATGERLPPVTVPGQDFPDLKWIPRFWGVRPILFVSRGKAHLVARAAQEVSLDNLVQERVFTYTGWREVDEEWGYLCGAGHLTANGLNKNIKVDLGTNNLQHYTLAAPPKNPKALQQAVRASLDFLKVGPLRVTTPLWAAMYTSVLTDIRALYTVLWVYGSTQSGKSTATYLAQCHFGPGFISGRQYHPPANWESSLTALEGNMFTAKDAAIIIDDYAPQFASGAEARKLGKTAAKIVRGVGNRTARERANYDLSQRKTRIPRGLVLVTAELPLAGQSTVGRMLYVPVEKGDLLPLKGEPPRAALDQAQQDAEAGLYAHAMAAFIQWLAAHWSRATQLFGEFIAEGVRFARHEKPNLSNRLPDYFALLNAGQRLALTAFHELGVVSTFEATELATVNATALLELLDGQEARIAAESPVRKFFEALDSLFERRQVYLAPRTKDVTFEPPPRADPIGWFDPQNNSAIYLRDVACLEHVRAFWQGQGQNFDTTADAQRRQISQVAGLLAQRGQGRNIHVVKHAAGKSRRVLAIDLEKVHALYGIMLQNEPSPNELSA